MAEWPLQQGVGHAENLFTLSTTTIPQTTGGGNITAAASANTKGSWGELVASTASRLSGLFVVIGNGNGTARDFRIDFGIGGSGSEQVLVPDLLYSVASDLAPSTYFLPVRIPVGSRVSARSQSSTGSSTCNIAVYGISQGFSGAPGFGQVTCYGIPGTDDSGGTEYDPGGSANTKASWTQVVSSTSQPIKQMLVVIGNIRNNNQVARYQWAMDVGVGAALSETIVIPDLWFLCDTPSDGRVPAAFGPFPCDIPAGTRLAVRAQCSGTDATDRKFDVLIYGFS